MWRRSLATVAGLLALLAGAGSAKADDVIRLGGADTEAKTLKLGFDGEAGTELVRYGGRGGFHGGGRGYYGGHGYHGGRGYYGGYGYHGGRGYDGGYGYGARYYGGGFYRPYNAGFYRPFYRSYSYPRYYGYYNYPVYSYYQPYTYTVPSYYYYTPPYPLNPYPMPYAPVLDSGTVVNGGPGRYVDYYAVRGVNGQALPSASTGNGTYPYDGGPSSPIPLPKDTPAPAPQPAPAKLPAAKAAPGTLLVSFPAQPTTVAPARQPAPFAYPAYGEDNRASSFASDRAPTRKTSR